MSIDLRRARIAADPVRTYYLVNAVLSLCTAIAFTLSAVYSVEVVRLDPFQLVLVGTVMEASCFVFEIPTGVIADPVSRRLSVLLGLLLMAGAFALLAAASVLWAVLLAQAVWGLGCTCISGAADAWVTDEVGAKGTGGVFQRECSAPCPCACPSSSPRADWSSSPWCWPSCSTRPGSHRRRGTGCARRRSAARCWPACGSPPATGPCGGSSWSACSRALQSRCSTGSGPCRCSRRTGCLRCSAPTIPRCGSARQRRPEGLDPRELPSRRDLAHDDRRHGEDREQGA